MISAQNFKPTATVIRPKAREFHMGSTRHRPGRLERMIGAAQLTPQQALRLALERANRTGAYDPAVDPFKRLGGGVVTKRLGSS